MSYGVSLKVTNYRQALFDAAEEADEIASDDIDSKMDLATRLLRKVTPVDTGFARSRWQNRKNILTPGGVIENDADYIAFLNQGSSNQAPAFFIEQVLMTAKLM